MGTGSAAQGKGPEYLIANPARNELYVQYFEIIGAEGLTIFLVNLLIIDLVKKNVVSKRQLFNSLQGPPVHGMAFTFNSSNGGLYVSKSSKNVVLKFDPLVKKPLKTIHLGKAPLWKRFASVLFEFAEPVAVDNTTSRVYVTDSGKSLLYEVVG